ncbi:hypothetical protein Sjap_009257 [Stephania japonica]|uniref:Uncharacterized protein n=1 Tax=Stephania japonica TaxID=461633 RepID=A0AAP0JSK4_9MAGN
MPHRVKVSYLLSYYSNLQFMLSRMPLSTLESVLCVLSALVLLKATFKSLVSKQFDLCEGSIYVYKWSIMIAFVSQIITIAIASLAIAFRRFSSKMEFKMENF